MPFDPSGNFTRDYNFVDDRDNGIKVLAPRMDGEFDNYATALNQLLLRNGVAAMTGNLNMGNFTLTNLGDGSVAIPAIRFQNSTSTGLYSPAANKVALTADGTNRVEANTTGALVTGTLGVSGAGTFSSTLGVTGAATFSGTSAHTGAATFASTVAVSGALTAATTLGVTGNTTVGGTLGVTGAGTFSSTLAVTGNTTVGGTLGVTGLATVGGSLAVTGAATFANTLGVTLGATVGGTFGVTGATTLNSTLGVVGTGTFVGAVTVGTTLGVTGASTLSGNTTVGGTFGVTGATTLSSTLAVTGASTLSGNTTVGGTLGVTGATTLSSTLGVTGAATLSGNTTVGGTLGVTGATTLSSTLGVTGATTLSSTLGVTGAATLSGNTTVGGTFGVTGAATFASTLGVTGTATFSGNVGIGETSPAAKLSILGASSDTVSLATANLSLQGGGGNGLVIGTAASGPYATYFQSGYIGSFGAATYPISLNPLGGNVGIGTTSPAAPLQVNGCMIAYGNSAYPTSGATAKGVYSLGGYYDGTVYQAGSSGFALWYDGTNYKTGTDGGSNGGSLVQGADSGDRLAFYTVPSTGGTQQTISPANLQNYVRMSITSAGKVGIGTTNPTDALTVATASGAAYVNVKRASQAAGQVAFQLTGGSGGVDWILYQNTSSDNLRIFGNSADRVTIDTSGHVTPGADNTQNFGSGSLRWGTIYAGTGTINTSDERYKVLREGGELTDAEYEAWSNVRAIVYRDKDAFARKGDAARLHIGYGWKAVKDAFAAQGLEAGEYGLWCEDALETLVTKTRTSQRPVEDQYEEVPVLDENGKPVFEEVPDTEEVEQEYEEVRIVDGMPVLFKETRTVQQPRYITVQVKDEAGNPVLEKNDTGKLVSRMAQVPVLVLKAKTETVPVMEDYEQEYDEMEPTGETRGALRYQECAVLEAAWLRKKVVGIEARLVALETA